MEINKKDKFTVSILMGYKLIQWAFPANRYLSARRINSFSESSEMFVGPFIKKNSSHLSSTTLLTNHNVLSFLPVSSSFPFYKLSHQHPSPPHLWKLLVSYGATCNFHQFFTLLFLMFSSSSHHVQQFPMVCPDSQIWVQVLSCAWMS